MVIDSQMDLFYTFCKKAQDDQQKEIANPCWALAKNIEEEKEQVKVAISSQYN